MKVSVICPTWNRGGVIQNAIRSIIDQTYKDWEMIIIDDGSIDSTERVVREFAYPKIRYHKIEHQNNISRVRNIGNSLATGEIIVVQDSDDLSFPDRLEKIVRAFGRDIDVVYHGMYIRGMDSYQNAITRMVRPAQPFNRERLKKEQYIAGQIAYRRNIRITYNEEIVLMDDFMFLLELAYNGKIFRPIYENLYEYVASYDSVNVDGEKDGRRLQDVRTIIRVLNKKYGIDAHATLTKQVIGGNLISKLDV